MTAWAENKKTSRLKTILTSIWNEFVYGGHLLSISDASLVLAVMIIFDVPISLPLLVVAYLMPQLVYSLDHVKSLRDDEKTNPERVKYLEKNKLTYQFMAIIYFIALSFLIIVYSNVYVAILTAIVGLGGLLYPKSLTKKIIGFKNYYVGLLSAFALCFLPFYHYNLPLNNLFIVVLIFAFLRLFLNTVYFDFKDYESDKNNKYKTIVVAFGKNKAIILLSVINVLSALIIIGSVFNSIIPSFMIGLAFVAGYSLVYLLLTKKLNGHNLRKVSYVMVDGEYIFWPILLLIFKGIL